MSWRTLIPMVVSCAAMLAGFMSIVVAARGEYLASAQLIMLSMILDGFDGNIARLLKGTTKFGGEFDTYVDIMSFGLAPALLGYWAVLSEFGVWGLTMAAATVLSGMLRLSRFRAMDDDRGMRGYTGLPITVNAAWIALTVYLFHSEHLPLGPEAMGQWPVALLVWSVSGALLVLQISNVRYGKPTKRLVFIIPSAVLTMGLFLKLHFGVVCALGMCAYGVAYAFLSPFLPRGGGAEVFDGFEDLEEIEDEMESVGTSGR